MDVDAATVQDPAAPATPVAPGMPVAPAMPVTLASPAASDAPASPRVDCPAPVISSTPFACTVTIGTPVGASGDALLRVTVPPGLFHLENSARIPFDARHRLLALPVARAARDSESDGGAARLTITLIADEAGAGRTRTVTASLSATGGEAVDAVEAGGPVEQPREAPPLEASATFFVEPGPPVISSAIDAPRTPLTATFLILAAIVAGLVALRRRRRASRMPTPSGGATAATSAPGRWVGGAFISGSGGSSASTASAASTASTPSSAPVDKQAIGASAVFGGLSLLLLFFCMPACIETVRARTAFVATTCTIVDSGSSGLAPEITYVPMAVVRYVAEGRPVVASGFDVRGTMYGSNDPDASRQFAAGGKYPCWYDPTEPRRVILRQGPSAVAWFTLLPITVLALTLSALLGVWRD